MTDLGKERIVTALRDEWASIDELISGLDDEQWSWPSPLPGWDVRANVVHMFGTEAALLGRTPPVKAPADDVEHVKNPIGAVNESWIAPYADRSPSELVDEFRSLTGERLAVLEAMSEEQWNEVGFTPAGQAPYGRFMQIRVFDCWMHEQDIRYAIRMPGRIRPPGRGLARRDVACDGLRGRQEGWCACWQFGHVRSARGDVAADPRGGR
ncbi:MAG: maleylpyruvate isomerase family mycothiol-dependent enzyme [Ilumatobacteraceae bacterium]